MVIAACWGKEAPDEGPLTTSAMPVASATNSKRGTAFPLTSQVGRSLFVERPPGRNVI